MKMLSNWGRCNRLTVAYDRAKRHDANAEEDEFATEQ